MTLKTFLSVLLVYRSNFHVLHWLAKGENFFTIHEKTSEYYEEILKDADVIAEMILRRPDGKIVNYKEALLLVTEYTDHAFLLLDTDRYCYDSEDFKKYASEMFKDIIICIEELLDTDYIQKSSNVGIKSTLEAMHDKYDLQLNYLLNRFGN